MNEQIRGIEKFLLKEYSNISNAHFKAIESISSFFRYYLLIMTIPISVSIIIFKLHGNYYTLTSFISEYQIIVILISTCIAFIGVGMLSYIINLRMDTILYARTVNSIRKYFYDDEKDIDLSIKLRMRTLPQSPWLPHYFEKTYFLPVIFVFFIVNTIYAIPVMMKISTFQQYLPFPNLAYPDSVILLCGIGLSVLFHMKLYEFFTRHREYAYLRSNIIGIDIDGVLNKHREQFCSILKEKTDKDLLPDDILVMPVHENHISGSISREEERKVFNSPEYWINMPAREQAASNIKKIKNVFNSKIFVFTHRPWPDAETKDLMNKYKQEFFNFCKYEFCFKTLSRCPWVKIDPLKEITKRWLKDNEFTYDKLIFEKGNDYTAFPEGNVMNRFQISQKNKIRFFVEDDLEKAIKLSFICDVVFLISHPYNKVSKTLPEDINDFREKIPSNIVRVKEWSEIYKLMRLYV